MFQPRGRKLVRVRTLWVQFLSWCVHIL
jgi:hypothetical protein